MRVTMKALAPPAARLTSKPDMAPGDQVEWLDGKVQVYADGSFAAAAGVQSFRFRVKQRRWGNWATVKVL